MLDRAYSALDSDMVCPEKQRFDWVKWRFTWTDDLMSSASLLLRFYGIHEVGGWHCSTRGLFCQRFNSKGAGEFIFKDFFLFRKIALEDQGLWSCEVAELWNLVKKVWRQQLHLLYVQHPSTGGWGGIWPVKDLIGSAQSVWLRWVGGWPHSTRGLVVRRFDNSGVWEFH